MRDSTAISAQSREIVQNRLNVDIVIVTYNSQDDLTSMWAGREFADGTKIYVVDNGSSDRSATIAREFADEIYLNTNEGLSRANNRGAGLGESPYIIFCNPDVALSDSDIARLCGEVSETGGIVAPRLVGKDGSLQPNARSYPSPIRQMSHRLRKDGPTSRRYLWPDGDSAQVDWVTGAAVAMRRSHFEKINGWPEDLFLYFEDVELCIRAKNVGIPVSVAEDIRVMHAWAKESGNLFSSALRRHLTSALTHYRRHPRHLFFI